MREFYLNVEQTLSSLNIHILFEIWLSGLKGLYSQGHNFFI